MESSLESNNFAQKVLPVIGSLESETTATVNSETSTIKLQALIRAYLARRRLRNRIWNEISDHSKSDKCMKGRELLRYGMLITNDDLFTSQHPERRFIVAICDLINKSMSNNSMVSSFAALFLTAEYMNASSKLITKMFSYIFKLAKQADVTKIIDSRAMATFSITLDLFSHCSEKWAVLRGNQQIVAILEVLCTKMSILSATAENIAILKQLIFAGLKHSRHSLNDKTIDEFFAVILRFMRIGNIPENDACEIFFKLLKVPTVTLSLSRNTLTELSGKGQLFSKSIGWLSAEQNQESILSMNTNEALNVVANLIHLSNCDRETVTGHLMEWARLVNILLQKCSHKSSKQSQNNCWHHPLLGWTSERIDASSPGAYEKLRRQLAYLWNCSMVRCLSGHFLSRDIAHANQPPTESNGKKSKLKHSDSNSNEDSMPLFQMFLKKLPTRANLSEQNLRKRSQERIPLPPISPTIVLCQLYRSALNAFPNSEAEILSSLGQDNSLILLHLWNFINEDIGGRLQTYLGYLVTDPEVQVPHFAPLQLFADIAFSLISILDEKEMYESERPFNRDQYRQIALFANKFCFRAIWDELIDFEKGLPSKLFNSLYQLLQILHNRDCRRQFVSDLSFWTINEVPPKHLVAEFERSGPKQRAHLLMEKMPHIIPLRDRIVLFRKLVSQDKDLMDLPTTIITVERSRLIEDGYRQLGTLTNQAIRGTVRVKFINQQGLDEAGIDQDGVFKEFLELTLKKIFNPDLNLFKSTNEKLLYPSSTSSIQENHLDLFQFVGRMLAKAVYEGICVDVQLAPVLLASVLNKQLYPFDELATLDPVLYKNLTYLKHYADSEDAADLELTFCFQEEFLGKITTVELISGGRDIKVDNENKISYIHLMAHYRVIKQIRDQSKNFVLGFRSVIQEKWLSLFSTHELQFLISGKTSDIDLADLKKNVQYYGGFHTNHRLIKWLWSILEQDFTMEERRLFLKFVTSCSRPPLLGFSFLEPSFSIRCIETSDDLDQGDTLGSVIRGFLAINKRKQPVNERLPTASTCFNLLKLPNYTKRSVLLEKLRYAIHSETGFELS